MTVTVDAPAVRLRLLPVPSCEPPYDDELPDEPAPLPPSIGVQGSLALQLTPIRPPRPALRLVEPPPADDPDDDAPRPTSSADLPPVAPWAHRLVIGVLEALAGTRPLVQLERLTTDGVYTQLQRAVAVRSRSRRPCAAGSRAVRSVRVSEPRDGVAEISAVVRAGDRCRAMALRVEGLDGRWRCTALHLG